VVPPFVGCPVVALDEVVVPDGGLVESVLVARSPPPVVWEAFGGPATDTVLVAEPHPPSTVPPATTSAAATVEERVRLITAILFAA
jgi:hypothetical protein